MFFNYKSFFVLFFAGLSCLNVLSMENLIQASLGNVSKGPVRQVSILDHGTKETLKSLANTVHQDHSADFETNRKIIEGFSNAVNDKMIDILNVLQMGNPYQLHYCMRDVKSLLDGKNVMLLCAVWWSITQQSSFNRLQNHNKIMLLYNKQTQEVTFQCPYTFFSDGLQKKMIQAQEYSCFNATIRDYNHTLPVVFINDKVIKSIAPDLTCVDVVPSTIDVPFEDGYISDESDVITWHLQSPYPQTVFTIKVYLKPVDSGNSDLFYIVGDQDTYNEYTSKLQVDNFSIQALHQTGPNQQRINLIKYILLGIMISGSAFLMFYVYKSIVADKKPVTYRYDYDNVLQNLVA